MIFMLHGAIIGLLMIFMTLAAHFCFIVIDGVYKSSRSTSMVCISLESGALKQPYQQYFVYAVAYSAAVTAAMQYTMQKMIQQMIQKNAVAHSAAVTAAMQYTMQKMIQQNSVALYSLHF